MTTFSQNFTITAAVPAVNPKVVVDLNTPLVGTGVIAGQPIVASSFAFGISAGSNFDNYISMDTAGYRAALAAVGGFHFYRLNLDNLGVQGGGMANPGLNTNLPASIPELDHFFNTMTLSGFTGRICCGLGGGIAFNNNEYSKMANLAIQVAKYAISKGIPFTHWEGRNEPDNGGNPTSDTDVGGQCAAVADAFIAAGAPYNTYMITGPTVSNIPPYRATNFQNWVTNMGNRSYGMNFHYYGASQFTALPGNTLSQLTNAIDPNNGYGAMTRAAKAYKTGAPVLIGEYSMAGYLESNDEVQNNWGALYAAMSMMDGIKGGNLEMGAVWDAVENSPPGSSRGSTDVFGIINGDNSTGACHNTVSSGAGGAQGPLVIPPFAPFPIAWCLGRLSNYMPGPVVTTTLDTALQSKLYVMATKDATTGAFKCLCICNYDRSGATTPISIQISTAPANLTLFEISADDPAPPYGTTTPVKRAITSGSLNNITLKSGSVVIISTAP